MDREDWPRLLRAYRVSEYRPSVAPDPTSPDPAPPPERSERVAGLVQGLLASASIGFMSALVRLLRGHFPPGQLIWIRALVGLVATAPLWWRDRGSAPPPSRSLILRGILGSLSILLYFWLLQRVPVGLAQGFRFLTPGLIGVFSALALGELPHPAQWLGMALVGTGLALLMGPGGLHAPPLVVLGGLAAAASTAAGLTALRAAARHHPAHQIVGTFMVCMFLIGLVTPSGPWTWPVGPHWLLIGAIGFFGYWGQVQLSRAFERLSAPVAGTLGLCSLVWGVLFEALLTEYSPGVAEMGAYGVLLLGAAILVRYEGANRMTQEGTQSTEHSSPDREGPPAPEVRSGHARVEGIDLWYEDGGSGEVVVLVPGLGGATDLWHAQSPVLRERYRVISLDNRGAGRSDKPQTPYSMDGFAADLAGLLDHLGIDEPVHLVGASMGGVIAQAFVHTYPERVRSLALVCTGVSSADPHISVPGGEVLARLQSPGDTPEAVVQTLLDCFYHPDHVAAHPELREFFLNRKREPQPRYAYLLQLGAIADPRPYYEWLAEVPVPTLVIHGADDRIWPVANAHTLAEGLGERGELVVMGGAGHMLFEEQPEVFNQHLMGFLERVGA